MNKTGYILLAVLILAVVVHAAMVLSLSGKLDTQDKHFKAALAATQDSLRTMQRQVDSLKQQVPGLGEYMSAIQLHIAKIWFAGQALNWNLASYELNELGEAVDGAEALHALRDSVNVTGVLQSVHNTQLETLRQSILSKQHKTFLNAYAQTLDACNSCHRSAGYSFIHIVTPTAPPVTNQSWGAATP